MPKSNADAKEKGQSKKEEREEDGLAPETAVSVKGALTAEIIVEGRAESIMMFARILLNLLKNEKTAKIGIAGKRKSCGGDNQYLLKVIGQ